QIHRYAVLVLSVDRGALFFFFQAEDGIRDYKVTGVQTCALPISTCGSGSIIQRSDGIVRRTAFLELLHLPSPRPWPSERSPSLRSEERRVGKEPRLRRSRRH